MLGTLELEEAAAKAAGNWKRFDSFVWFRDRELDDADQWSVIYTHNRDSGLLDQSNAHVISQAMESFTDTDDPDVVFESHSHWAVGHVDGFSLRVFNAIGEITSAFRAYHELGERLDDYPESEVYSWLSDDRSGEIENKDDQGGYPSEQALRAAFEALGFEEEKE